MSYEERRAQDNAEREARNKQYAMSRKATK